MSKIMKRRGSATLVSLEAMLKYDFFQILFLCGLVGLHERVRRLSDGHQCHVGCPLDTLALPARGRPWRGRAFSVNRSTDPEKQNLGGSGTPGLSGSPSGN